MKHARFLPVLLLVASCSAQQLVSTDTPSAASNADGTGQEASLPPNTPGTTADGGAKDAGDAGDGGKDGSSTDGGQDAAMPHVTRNSVELSNVATDASFAGGKLWFVTTKELRLVDDVTTGSSHVVVSWPTASVSSSVAVGTSQVFVARAVYPGTGFGYVAEVSAVDIATGTLHAVGTVQADSPTSSTVQGRYPIVADGDTAYLVGRPNAWRANVATGISKVVLGNGSNLFFDDLLLGPAGMLYSSNKYELIRFGENGGSWNENGVPESGPGLFAVTSGAVYSTQYGDATHTIQKSDLALSGPTSTFASFGALGLGSDDIDLYAARQTNGFTVGSGGIGSAEIVALSLATGAVERIYDVKYGPGWAYFCTWSERRRLIVSSTHVFGFEGPHLIAFAK